MSKDSKIIYRSSGIGFSGMLAICFIALKLSGNINWSWLWILCPLWLPVVITIGIILIVLLISFIATLIS